jgi:hypothetical protein
MIYYGHGGFTFSDLYEMPVYLRNFYFRKMADVKNKEAEANNPKQQNIPDTVKNKIHRPDIPRKKK